MRTLVIILSLGIFLNFSVAQRSAKIKDADEILTNVVKGFERVQDFSALIDAEVNMERMQIPKMHAELFFKRPDKVHFSSKGFLLVPREGVALNPSLLQEHYLPTGALMDSLEGKTAYKLYLAAKDPKTRLRSLSVWIDPMNWTLLKMETIPYEGRTLVMVFTYECQEEKYWLPVKMVASFTTESDKPQKDSTPPAENQFDTMQRSMPRSGSVTVVYSNYRINRGLSDELFEKKE